MKPCQRERAVESWFDLSDDERQVLREHARSCASCAARIAALSRVEGLLERGRETYLGLRYSGPRPAWQQQKQRTWGVTWFGWMLRPAPALVAALLVLVAALTLDRSGFSPPPSSSADLERPAASETVKEVATVRIEPHAQEGQTSEPKDESLAVVLEFESVTEPEVGQGVAFGFSKPPGQSLTLTAARRAVRAEWGEQALPARPNRPSGVGWSFPKRPNLLPISSEDDVEEKAG